MASEKPDIDNAVAFAQLFDTILAYITYNNNNAEDLQTVDEMFQKIHSYAENNGGVAELMAGKEDVYKMMSLVVMTIRDRIAGVAPAPAIRTVAVLVDRATETCDVPEPLMETTAAVELDQSYAAPVETLKSLGGRFAVAWKSVKRAALRLCLCDTAQRLFEQRLPSFHLLRRRHLAGRRRRRAGNTGKSADGVRRYVTRTRSPATCARRRRIRGLRLIS